jgi:hypothetical protein
MTSLKKPAIPFGRLFQDEGGIRNAKLALRDPKTPADLRAALERYLANPVKASLDDAATIQRSHAAPFRSGRVAGTTNERTRRVRTHIANLREKYPRASPAQLFKKADKEVIGGMAEKTFADHARATPKK